MSEVKIQGISLAGGAIIASLIDVLHDKGILSIDEARNILMLALHQTRVYGSTVEGVEAQRIIEDMLSNRFSARRE